VSLVSRKDRILTTVWKLIGINLCSGEVGKIDSLQYTELVGLCSTRNVVGTLFCSAYSILTLSFFSPLPNPIRRHVALTTVFRTAR